MVNFPKTYLSKIDSQKTELIILFIIHSLLLTLLNLESSMDECFCILNAPFSIIKKFSRTSIVF